MSPYYPPKSEHKILNTRDMISSLSFPRNIPIIICFYYPPWGGPNKS